MTALGGFFLASKGSANFGLLLAMISGLSLIIACGCVLNNYIDRDIDAKMQRTKKRALVQAVISTRSALIYAGLLGIIGSVLLGLFTNLLTLTIALVGLITYVGFYTPLKRRSIHSTLAGSIPGATPPVVGYCAVTGQLDLAAGLLFFILVLWQLPHFYAISIYRLKEYRAAGLPVMAVSRGVQVTKILIVSYIVAFTAVVSLLSFYGYTGAIYLVVMVLLGIAWLYKALRTFKIPQNGLWARKVFLFSLVVITGFSIMLSIDNFLV